MPWGVGAAPVSHMRPAWGPSLGHLSRGWQEWPKGSIQDLLGLLGLLPGGHKCLFLLKPHALLGQYGDPMTPMTSHRAPESPETRSCPRKLGASDRADPSSTLGGNRAGTVIEKSNWETCVHG